MKRHLALFAALSISATMSQAATVSITDVIADGERDHFYGFEDLPSTGSFGATTSGDNITVTQVGGQSNDIWTGYLPGGGEGNRAWYANGGDRGYTAIRTTDGSDLDALGLLVGNGNSSNRTAHYSLRLDGAEVASGSFVNSGPLSYIGFTDVTFDEVYLISVITGAFSFFGDGTQNALVVDAIEVSLADTPAVPLPAGGLMLLSGLAGFGLMRRRAKH